MGNPGTVPSPGRGASQPRRARGRAAGRVRGLRRQARKDLDDVAEGGGVSKDDVKWVADQIDELIHKYEAKVEQARSAKEDELLEV